MGSIIAGFTLEVAAGPQSGETLRHAITTGVVPLQNEALTDSYSMFVPRCSSLGVARRQGDVLPPCLLNRTSSFTTHQELFMG